MKCRTLKFTGTISALLVLAAACSGKDPDGSRLEGLPSGSGTQTSPGPGGSTTTGGGSTSGTTTSTAGSQASNNQGNNQNGGNRRGGGFFGGDNSQPEEEDPCPASEPRDGTACELPGDMPSLRCEQGYSVPCLCLGTNWVCEGQMLPPEGTAGAGGAPGVEEPESTGGAPDEGASGAPDQLPGEGGAPGGTAAAAGAATEAGAPSDAGAPSEGGAPSSP